MNDQSYAAALREESGCREEKKPCCRRSYAAGLAGEPPPDFACAGDAGCYLRGVFVRCGSMTDPDKGYYLSLRPARSWRPSPACWTTPDCRRAGRSAAACRCCIIGTAAKSRIFWRLSGQSKHALELMDKKITRALRNNANRLANAETANYDRAATASAEQVNAIKLLIKHKEFKRLSPELAESAALRLRHPELDLASLAELHEKRVSKSGLNHRMEKLLEMAKKYQ